MSPTSGKPNSPLLLASLSSLPEELCLPVIENCDMPSIIALSMTNRKFQRLADPNGKARHSLMLEFLAKAQDFPQWQLRGEFQRLREGWRKCGYICYTCKKVLPSDRFADKDVKGTRGGRAARRYTKRGCIQCGLKTGRLAPGSVVKQGDTRRFVCRQCGELNGGRACAECRMCRGCDLYGFEILACETKGHRCFSFDCLPL
jgi:hypothetical protein